MKMGNGMITGYKQRNYKLPCSRGSQSSSRKHPHRVLVGGCRGVNFNDNSFTVRGIRGGDRSMSRRLRNMYSFHERGTDPDENSGGFFSSDKDRLENVLLCIFAEAALKSAFFDFLSERCMENLLSFRDEVEYLKTYEFTDFLSSGQNSPSERGRVDHNEKDVEKMSLVATPVQRVFPCLGPPQPDRELVSMVMGIYSRYISDSSAKQIPIDYVAKQTINDTLKITSGGRIAERNPHLLRNAFDEAVSKIFHQLIYDHLAHFLMSDYYKAANKPIEPLSLDYEVDEEEHREEIFHTIIAHPVCSYYFKNYLRNLKEENTHRRFPVVEQVECLNEMVDFCTSVDPIHRAERCSLIIKRYGRMAYGIEELIIMRNELVSYGENPPDKYVSPDPNIFNTVYYRLSNALLAEHLHGFLASTDYQDLEDYTSKQEVFVALDRFKDGNLGARLRELSGVPTFGLNEDALYDAALEDPLGISLFKRFVTSHLQEENIDFYLEVRCFKDENYSTPPTGSAIFYDDCTSVEQMRFMRAMKICEKYIEVGSQMQINISTKMREHILRALTSVDQKVPLDIFDAAQEEVKKLMKLNLWKLFRTTDSYALFVNKFREKRYTANRAVVIERMEADLQKDLYKRTKRITKFEGIKRMASIGKEECETVPSSRMASPSPKSKSSRDPKSTSSDGSASQRKKSSQSSSSNRSRDQSKSTSHGSKVSVTLKKASIHPELPATDEIKGAVEKRHVIHLISAHADSSLDA